jgi:hypothetical protein
MVSEVVSKHINEAGEYYKQAEQMGVDAAAVEYCRFCEGALNSINVYIHNEEQSKLVVDKNVELDLMFRKEFNERCKKIEVDDDYLKRYNMYKSIEVKMHLWKAGQKLNFYDWLIKKYDI